LNTQLESRKESGIGNSLQSINSLHPDTLQKWDLEKEKLRLDTEITANLLVLVSVISHHPYVGKEESFFFNFGLVDFVFL